MDPISIITGIMANPWFRKIAVCAVIFLAGFGAGEAWEHRGEQKGMLALAGQGLKVQRDRARGQRDFANRELALMSGRKTAWQDAHGRCETQRKRENQKAADEVNINTDRRTASEQRAFDSGYLAGKVVGRKSCGAPTNATPLPDPRRPAGQPRPGGVRNDAEADPFWGSAAYRPGG